MDFDLPRGVIFAVDDVRLALDPSPHPYECANGQAIEESWRREKAKNPSLFDGQVALLSTVTYRNRRIEGRCHAVRYATLLHWRNERPVATVEHIYAHAMPVARDGALIAVRMAAHTANAGRVYFAAGSFEPEDFPGGIADVDGNMEREVREETGLDFSAVARDPRYHAYSAETGTVIVKRYHLDEPAERIAERIRRFVAAERRPEIEEPVIIRAGNDLPPDLAPHMPPLIRWHFANSPSRMKEDASAGQSE